MKKVYFLFIFSIVFLLFESCTNNTSKNIELQQELFISSFTIQTPDDWQWEQDQGIDTFIGKIFNSEEVIYFDQGYLSFGYLEDVEASERTISFQKLNINGVPAIIEKEKTSNEEIDRDIRLSVYLDEGQTGRQNRLYTYDPKNEDLILAIFKSHNFVELSD